MKPLELIEMLKTKLPESTWEYDYNREQNSLKITRRTLKKGITISIGSLIAKYELNADKAIDEVVYLVEQTFLAMEKEQKGIQASLDQVYPIIRSTSFPKVSKGNQEFLTEEHTAETRIFYALDLGNTYRLLDVEMVKQLGWSNDQVKESARFQVKKLPVDTKMDIVSDNVFYFLNHNDGYDASRLLNEKFLEDMSIQIQGDMTLSVPHQDVLIIGDIRNEMGYDILAQMTMHFFTTGKVPITSLSFVYENGELEPIFILAKTKPDKEKDK
ncbi:DUF1444 family protein [Paenisporosarcina cavernae]|uniref:DUF1444 family protein n=1 Tax=Paenisporosarcina cavernae TaxID=2320858 RepID=A0A385YSU6_9BACL|nr:DUF1444 family protein [Paenisporosarcina cavernae]AYC29879.1 DUF1444 family protein [Paenisporosarcina cavernae]